MRNFNDDEFPDFAELTREKDMEVRFIEFMPFDKNDWKTKKFIPQDEIMEHIKKQFPVVEPLANEKSAVSKAFQIPGHKGRLGFISSMSKHFCGGCNRLRVTADGNLKVCLFDNNELNLKQMLATHTDEQLHQVI
jgi:molybdenum cofactor biosynthesis enzyme MoaA